MAKHTPQHRKKIEKTVPAPKPAARQELSFARTPSVFMRTGVLSLFIFMLAFAAYFNTLHHGFTLDDEAVITGNAYTKAGLKGIPDILTHDSFQGFLQTEDQKNIVAGGRYRPLSVILFAAIWQFFGENPFVFHLVTVLLYALTCLTLYRTLLLLFQERLGAQRAGLLSIFGAILYTLHPVHTEAVANVKGCDEILSMLLSLVALYSVLKYADTQKKGWIIGAAAAFFAACLSKENAATFLLVIPLSLYFFRNREAQDLKQSAQRLFELTAPLLVAFAVFFVLRGFIVNWTYGSGTASGLMNNPFVKVEGDQWVPFRFTEKLATVFYTLGLYVKLLVFPHPLTHDYYPRHIGIMTFSSPGAFLSLLLYIALAVLAVRGFRQRTVLSFGIFVFMITLSIVSNLVIPVGTNMSERFLFMPSVGFAVVAGQFLLSLTAGAADWSGLRIPLAVLGIAGALFLTKTVTRNRDWVSNDVLFFKDIEVSKNSAKIQTSCGASLYNRSLQEADPGIRRHMVDQALGYLNRAISIHPNHIPAIVYRGLCHEYLENYNEAIRNYAAVRRINPDYPVNVYMGRALRQAARLFYIEQQKDAKMALEYLNKSWEQNDQDSETAWLFGVVYAQMNQADETIRWFEKALALAPSNVRFMTGLSQAYRSIGNIPKAEEYERKAAAAAAK